MDQTSLDCPGPGPKIQGIRVRIFGITKTQCGPLHHQRQIVGALDINPIDAELFD